VNVPLLKVVNNDVVLLIKIIERRHQAATPPDCCGLLESTKEKDSNRLLKAFSVLPLSKLIWLESMRGGVMYQVDDAAVYKAPESGQVEMAYMKMALEKKLKKYKDIELT
jgi:hypothetical protein